ncbi:hypothetical protein BU15DRAFT_66775 [Melanogaster broomeanus]|nr:hypothetical protein BU15DRAFT_66775 [Melanogaster broomeanus]
MEALADPPIGLGAPLMSVPSQRLSQALDPRDGICAWCARPHKGPLNVCHECRAGGALRIGPSVARPSSSGANLKTYLNCASCLVPLQVHNHRSSSYILCTPCHARQASMNPKLPKLLKPPKLPKLPQPRANPYPSMPRVLTGVPALDAPFIFPPDPPVAAPPQNVNANGNLLRVCMRFGCVRDSCVQPRLSRNVSRDARRSARTCFPESRFDLVRAQSPSMSPTPTEIKDADDNMDLDLVYPEKLYTTLRTIPNRILSGYIPLADDDPDVELELVYPEDAAEVPCKSATKSTPRASSPVSLSTLFAGNLQSIPALAMAQTSDTTPTVASSTPRRQCKMAGCNEVLLSTTSMQRCVRCSLDHWKQRKQAALETRSSRSRAGPSPPAPAVETPMVLTPNDQEAGPKLPEAIPAGEQAALDGNGDRIVGVEESPESSVSPPSSPTSKNSSSFMGPEFPIDSIPGWESDLTDLSSSEDDDEAESRSEVNSGLKIRIPLLANRHPTDGSIRKCANKRCNIALSTAHRWKTCDPCRRAHREYQKMRAENIWRRVAAGIESYEPSLGHPRRRSPSADPETPETNLTLETSRPGVSLEDVRQVSAWARRDARRKRDALFGIQNPSHEPGVVSPFPAYQNRGVLLSSFGTQLQNFVEGQILYFRAKLRENGEGELSRPSPMVFAFDGEYSILTGQRGEVDSKPPGEDVATMRKEVFGMVHDLQCALRTKYKSLMPALDPQRRSPSKRVALSCCSLTRLDLIAPLCPLPLNTEENETTQRSVPMEVEEDMDEKSPSAVPLIKTLSGELEVAIVPDNSHKLFHGQRTIIRYQLRRCQCWAGAS